jgi:hypothetical protein
MTHVLNIQDIQAAFRPYQVNGTVPAQPSAIEQAERALGHALPASLKAHYLVHDGFRSPTYAEFLYPLTVLVETNQFLRSNTFPAFLHRTVAFGDYGIGSYWLMLLDGQETIVEWDAEWGDKYEVLNGHLADVWLDMKAIEESLGDGT